MELDLQKIENLRNLHESTILSINGVESVSIGLCDNGKPCLQIGISVSVDQIQTKLPADLSDIKVKLHYIDKVEAQHTRHEKLSRKKTG